MKALFQARDAELLVVFHQGNFSQVFHLQRILCSQSTVVMGASFFLFGIAITDRSAYNVSRECESGGGGCFLAVISTCSYKWKKLILAKVSLCAPWQEFRFWTLSIISLCTNRVGTSALKYPWRNAVRPLGRIVSGIHRILRLLQRNLSSKSATLFLPWYFFHLVDILVNHLSMSAVQISHFVLYMVNDPSECPQIGKHSIEFRMKRIFHRN